MELAPRDIVARAEALEIEGGRGWRDPSGLEAVFLDLKHLGRFRNCSLTDKSWVYNTELLAAVELDNMLGLAEVIVAGALDREESRGGHARRDFPSRNDTGWLKHTLARHTPQGPSLEYLPVNITRWLTSRKNVLGGIGK